MREDSDAAEHIQGLLQSAGIPVWRDKDDLWPGEDWRLAIRKAITSDAFVFIALFSDASEARATSYQREEMVLALEQLRLRRPDRSWFIPVRLSACDLSPYEIGGGRTLGDLTWIDYFEDWETRNAQRLIDTVRRILGLPLPMATPSGPAAGAAARPAWVPWLRQLLSNVGEGPTGSSFTIGPSVTLAAPADRDGWPLTDVSIEVGDPWAMPEELASAYDRYVAEAGSRFDHDGEKYQLVETPWVSSDAPNLHLQVRPCRYSEVQFVKELAAFDDGERRRLAARAVEAKAGVAGFAHALCLHALVVTADGKVLRVRRPASPDYYGGMLSTSLEEQLAPDDFAEGPDHVVRRWVLRLIHEELRLDPSDVVVDEARILSLFLESDIPNVALSARILLTLTGDQLARAIRERQGERMDHEFSTFDLVALDERSVVEALNSPATYHASAPYRLVHGLLHAAANGLLEPRFGGTVVEIGCDQGTSRCFDDNLVMFLQVEQPRPDPAEWRSIEQVVVPRLRAEAEANGIRFEDLPVVDIVRVRRTIGEGVPNQFLFEWAPSTYERFMGMSARLDADVRDALPGTRSLRRRWRSVAPTGFVDVTPSVPAPVTLGTVTVVVADGSLLLLERSREVAIAGPAGAGGRRRFHFVGEGAEAADLGARYEGPPFSTAARGLVQELGIPAEQPLGDRLVATGALFDELRWQVVFTFLLLVDESVEEVVERMRQTAVHKFEHQRGASSAIALPWDVHVPEVAQLLGGRHPTMELASNHAEAALHQALVYRHGSGEVARALR